MEKIIRKKENNIKGITLVSLVLTIIIMIILAGVAVSVTIGDDGIFKKAQTARERYIEAQEEEQRKINEIDARMNTIAALSDYDISASSVEELERIRTELQEARNLLNEKNELLTNLQDILQNTTATPAEILSGKTAYLQDSIKIGTMANRGNIGTQTLSSGGSYTIQPGYYSRRNNNSKFKFTCKHRDIYSNPKIIINRYGGF